MACHESCALVNAPLHHCFACRRKLCINLYSGKRLVDMREYYEKEGKELPGKKGACTFSHFINDQARCIALAAR